MSFENPGDSIEKVDKNNAYKSVREDLENKGIRKPAIDSGKYTHVSDNILEKDIKSTERKKELYNELLQNKSPLERSKEIKNREIANIFEKLFVLYAPKWLNENIIISLSSEFDDYNNKIDLIAEVDLEENYAVFGVDATTICDNREKINNKILENLKIIKEGETRTIKYFQSEVLDESGEYKKSKTQKMIPFVLGVSSGIVDEIIDIYEQIIHERNSKNDNSRKQVECLEKQIDSYRLHEIFFNEIMAQLKMYMVFTKEKHEEVYEECKRLYNIFNKLKKEKDVEENKNVTYINKEDHSMFDVTEMYIIASCKQHIENRLGGEIKSRFVNPQYKQEI